MFRFVALVRSSKAKLRAAGYRQQFTAPLTDIFAILNVRELAALRITGIATQTATDVTIDLQAKPKNNKPKAKIMAENP